MDDTKLDIQYICVNLYLICNVNSVYNLDFSWKEKSFTLFFIPTSTQHIEFNSIKWMRKISDVNHY